jgi:hypothetical protein
MGSKVLYFAAGGPGAPTGAPLVYDKNVHWALTNVDGGYNASNPDGYVSSAAYRQWVNFAADATSGMGLCPDDVELALFTARSWRRRRRRLNGLGEPR